MAKKNNRNGWIALHRKIQDSFLWKRNREFSQAEAWIDILMEAQHSEKPQKVLLGMTILYCYYGQSLKSIPTWAERWNWSESKVRRFFGLLRAENMVGTKNERKTTRLTVCNYGRYDPKRRANGGQTATDNNVNNDKYSQTSDEVRLSNLLFSEIRKRNPNFREPNIQLWAKHIDRLIRLDKRTPEQIEAVICWGQKDDFWQNNILSTEKLRKQFDQLELRMQQQTTQPSPAPLIRDASGRTPRERILAEMESERTQEYAR